VLRIAWAVVALAASFPLTARFPLAAQEGALPAGLVWGYIDNVDGLALTLDDGTTLKLNDTTKVIRLDGADGTPKDIAKGLRAELNIDAQGTVTRLELLPAPLAPEFYLSNLTVRGASGVRASVGGRTYPRSLSALKASFVGQASAVALVGGVAFTPPKESKVASARFAVVGPSNDVLFQRTVKAGEVADFRLNFPPGRADAYTLLASPVGEGTLQPEWCLWLDPKLVAPLPAPQGVGILRSTARALLADLKQALGEKQPGPLAIALFTPQRIRDDQALQDLQEDLVVGGVGSLQVVGKCAQRPELGMPVPDAAKAEAGKLGAKCLLVGSVSDRGDILVINAAVVDLANGQILATAQAWQ
jgi:hypothetical protein